MFYFFTPQLAQFFEGGLNTIRDIANAHLLVNTVSAFTAVAPPKIAAAASATLAPARAERSSVFI